MGRGRGRSRPGSFGNYSNRARQPVFRSASGGNISFLKVVLIALVLYFLLRFVLSLVWAVALVAILLLGLKYLFERF